MEARIAARRTLELRASEMTLHCIEAEVVEADFLVNKVATCISRSNYADIEEERSVAGLCGYPCCANMCPLSNKSQQFKIDSSNKRVYDLTNRRKFCSDWCYAASCFLSKQISDTPVWSSERETQKVPVRLYSKQSRGLPGDEFIMNEVLHELNQMKLEIGESSDNDLEINCSDNESAVETRYPDGCEKAPRKSVSFKEDLAEFKEEGAKVLFEESNYKKYCKLCNQIMSWRTDNTIAFLTDCDTAEEKSKTDDFCFKVARFYCKNQNASEENDHAKDSVGEASLVRLPNLDSRDQMKERREMLFRNVKAKFNSLKLRFGVTDAAWTSLTKLVTTFNLTSDNVFVDPTMSKVLLVILLRIISEFQHLVDSKDLENFEKFCIEAFQKFGYSDLNELENFVDCFWKL